MLEWCEELDPCTETSSNSSPPRKIAIQKHFKTKDLCNNIINVEAAVRKTWVDEYDFAVLMSFETHQGVLICGIITKGVMLSHDPTLREILYRICFWKNNSSLECWPFE